MKKNDIIRLDIDSCTLQGSGVGRHEGMAVFVSCTAPGDTLDAHILKVCTNHAFAKADAVLTESADREQNTCPAYPKCGGCVFRHIKYAAELKIKENQVRENLRRIGHIEVELAPITGADEPDRYRNKALYPVQRGEDGKLKIGFFAPRSHRVTDCRDCLLQPEGFAPIVEAVAQWIEENGVSVYDEATGEGLVRHVFIRQARFTGEIMAAVITSDENLPKQDELVIKLLEANESIVSIVNNINPDSTNVVLGKKSRTLFGGEYITDRLCGLNFAISPLSFYQVNPAQAQRIYEKAAEFAGLDGSQTVLDLYCGAGTIGLSMAGRAKKIIGVEIVRQAVENARMNALQNSIENAEFICADAGEAARKLADAGEKPDVVVLDPPRKGCEPELVSVVAGMEPEKIVYVSCDSATLARDCAQFEKLGYKVDAAAPFDMFPRTGHVECVVLMSRVKE